MIKKIRVEVPIGWFNNPIDGSKNKNFFCNFLIELVKFNIPIHLLEVPFGADAVARLPERGTLIFSYHSHHNSEKNVWHLKEAPIIPLFAIDKSGYSGWADISIHFEQYKDAIAMISNEISNHIINKYKNFFETTKESKYPQTNSYFTTPEKPYIFLPLQVQNDPVMRTLNSIDILDMIEYAAKQTTTTNTELWIKRHPWCNSESMATFLDSLTQKYPLVKIVDGNIHTLIKNAKAVIAVNSGTSIEALIDGAAVYITGQCEWMNACNRIQHLEDIANIFTNEPILMNDWQKKIIAYLLNEYWFDPNDPQAIRHQIQKCIQDFDPEYGHDPKSTDTQELFLPIILNLQAKIETSIRAEYKNHFDKEGFKRLYTDLNQQKNTLENSLTTEIDALINKSNQLQNENNDLKDKINDLTTKINIYEREKEQKITWQKIYYIIRKKLKH
ncbi:hypothetical protein PT286_07280 [Neisseriaceae bacterium ESL0693]|nr:hypothetical protein [Neisseriaceae bacterium ESL0693]